MKRNPAFGDWTEEETNWSQKDTDFIQDALKAESIPTSNKELLEMDIKDNFVDNFSDK